MALYTFKYIQHVWIGPLGVGACAARFTFGNCSFVVGMNMLLQTVTVKYMYTNVWCNVGSSNDELWTRVLWCVNVCHVVLLWASAPFHGYNHSVKMGICLGVPGDCLEAILDEEGAHIS